MWDVDKPEKIVNTWKDFQNTHGPEHLTRALLNEHSQFGSCVFTLLALE